MKVLFGMLAIGKTLRYEKINGENSCRIRSLVGVLHEDARVANLVDLESRWWNTQLVNDVFYEVDAQLVLSLPVSVENCEDQLAWKCTSLEKFTVESAYNLQQHLKIMSRGESSSVSTHGFLWKKIWSLSIPNIVKIFLWRECIGSLLTFLSCPPAKDVWKLAGKTIQRSFRADDFGVIFSTYVHC